MTTVLQLGNRSVTTEEIIPLLARYQMLPQLLRESIVDQAIASFSCSSDELLSACQQFYQQNRLTSDSDLQAWLKRHGMSREHLEETITRRVRIEKFQQATWGHQLESYFLKRKNQLDRVIYSFLRIDNPGVALELYFRIAEQEQTFAEVARQYSQGPEAFTGGIIGPVELGNLNPNLAGLLSMSQPGQLLPPQASGEWQIIVRLEKLMPAQLDEPMRKRLLKELFEAWLQERLNELGSEVTWHCVEKSAA